MKRISVIIPVYNAEKYLEKCVESIAPQLDERDEIILVNDGSKDNSLAICNQLKEKYPIIVVIDQENSGAAKSRNRGIKLSKGKYIAFIDNDDIVEDGYFEAFLRKIEETGADAVVGGYKRVEIVPKFKILFEVKGIDSEWFPFIVLAPWAKLYNGEFIRNNNVQFLEYELGEDIYFNIMLRSVTNKISTLNNTGYCWVMNRNSVSNTSQKKLVSGQVEHLLNEMLLCAKNDDKLVQFFYVRTVVFYLLFGGRNSTKKVFLDEYKSNFGWLKSHNIPQKFPSFSSKVKGEPVKNRIIIFIFLMLHHMRLMPLFAGIYCKGRD